MIEFDVGPIPEDITARLGEGFWRLQNRGRTAIYRTSSENMPDTTAVDGFRHAQGSIFLVFLGAGWRHQWLWTAADTVVVVAEPTPPIL